MIPRGIVTHPFYPFLASFSSEGVVCVYNISELYSDIWLKQQLHNSGQTSSQSQLIPFAIGQTHERVTRYHDISKAAFFPTDPGLMFFSLNKNVQSEVMLWDVSSRKSIARFERSTLINDICVPPTYHPSIPLFPSVFQTCVFSVHNSNFIMQDIRSHSSTLSSPACVHERMQSMCIPASGRPYIVTGHAGGKISVWDMRCLSQEYSHLPPVELSSRAKYRAKYRAKHRMLLSTSSPDIGRPSFSALTKDDEDHKEMYIFRVKHRDIFGLYSEAVRDDLIHGNIKVSWREKSCYHDSSLPHDSEKEKESKTYISHWKEGRSTKDRPIHGGNNTKGKGKGKGKGRTVKRYEKNVSHVSFGDDFVAIPTKKRKRARKAQKSHVVPTKNRLVPTKNRLVPTKNRLDEEYDTVETDHATSSSSSKLIPVYSPLFMASLTEMAIRTSTTMWSQCLPSFYSHRDLLASIRPAPSCSRVKHLRACRPISGRSDVFCSVDDSGIVRLFSGCRPINLSSGVGIKKACNVLNTGCPVDFDCVNGYFCINAKDSIDIYHLGEELLHSRGFVGSLQQEGKRHPGNLSLLSPLFGNSWEIPMKQIGQVPNGIECVPNLHPSQYCSIFSIIGHRIQTIGKPNN
ncbi:hypothetical protein ADUPG1_005972 [Aduncisulcus paluster]|uniref:Uncharacterized protein n=1 Tax=Aduncisulcus paluster TaxID=2918883 RepID=A0ABQ5KGB1_9EUKA|nr:hypothetical protein ADUPG1_005972 [Aduncisulcus paluster]